MADAVRISEMRVTADTSSYERGMSRVETTSKTGAAAATDFQTAIAGVAVTVQQTDTKISAAVNSAERLRRSFDTGHAAASDLARGFRDVSRYVDQGKISMESAIVMIGNMSAKYRVMGDATVFTSRNQMELAKAVEHTNEQLRQQAALATTASTRPPTMAANQNVDSEARFRRQNLGFQLTDIGQSAALGMPVGMIAMQQVPQIMQLYVAQGGLNAAMRDFGVILGTVARVAGPLVAILGGLYGGYKLLQSYSVEAGLGVSAATRALAEQAAPASSLKGQIAELVQVQTELNRTIADAARASSASIDTIISNSRREYEAKKALLELELALQEAKLATQRADIALQGQEMRQRVMPQIASDPGRAVRDGYADPRINGGIPFVRLPEDLSGLQKTMEALNADPANKQITKLRAEMTLAELAVEKLREVLGKTFSVGASPTSGGPTAQALSAQTAAIQSSIEALRQSAGSRMDIAGRVQNAAQFDQSQQDEIRALQQRASVIGMTAEAAARSNAIFQAEQQMRQQGISLLGQEADRRRAVAAATADYASAIQRSEQAYQSLQTAGSSAIDALTASTGSLSDRLKGAADAMLSWVTQLALANPLKNALFGTNLPTLADLGKPAVPGGATTTGMMTVTATTVMVNGGVTGGQFPGIPGSTPGTTAGGGLLDLIGGKVPANANSNPLSSSVDAVNALRTSATTTAAAGNIEAYIRQRAPVYGIDPNTAVAVARSEGGLTSWNRQSEWINSAGMREQSYGPYQLYMGGGLGNRFQQQTGLDPRLAGNGPAGVDFALQTASREGWGAWYGARRAGISDWQGIGKNPGIDTTTTNSINSASIAAKQFATNAQAASKDVSLLGTNSQQADQTLMDVLGGNKAPTGGFPAAPTASPNYFPPAPSAGFNPLSLLRAIPIFGPLMGNLFGFADGTDFAPGGMAIVGERGRELVNLPRGSQVTPTHKIGPNSEERMRYGPRAFNGQFNIVVSGNGDKELLERMRQAADMAVRDGIRAYDGRLPDRMEEISRNPEERVA